MTVCDIKQYRPPGATYTKAAGENTENVPLFALETVYEKDPGTRLSHFNTLFLSAMRHVGKHGAWRGLCVKIMFYHKLISVVECQLWPLIITCNLCLAALHCGLC